MRIRRLFTRAGADWLVKVLALAAAVLLFFYNRIAGLEETVFTVAVETEVSEELAIAADYPSRVRVHLRGSEEAISAASSDDFVAVLDATRFVDPGTYRVSVDVRRLDDEYSMSGLDIEPSPAFVTLELEERVQTTVEVSPSIVGFPARGYELTQSFVSPERVQIEGPERYVSARTRIATAPIDIGDRSESFTMLVELRPPNRFIRVRGSETVEFSGIVEESVVLTTFDQVAIVAVDLAEGLMPVEAPAGGSVTVQGPLLQLEETRREDIRLEADASEVDGAGVHTLPVRVEAPEGLLVVSYEPTEIVLEVESTNDDGTSPAGGPQP